MPLTRCQSKVDEEHNYRSFIGNTSLEGHIDSLKNYVDHLLFGNNSLPPSVMC